jgi:hypothetical protein
VRNKLLNDATANDIDKQVAKLLRDLGNPPPPLRLDEVRALLHLDLRYYSSTEDGILTEMVHKLTLAGKQILHRPSVIADVIKKFDLKALLLLDRKRILIDQNQPPLKWRWNETHEVIHSIVPWHEHLMFGDTKLTLTPNCHDQIEAEANYGTGRLLFMQTIFDKMVKEAAPNMETVKTLKKTFGNTITNTLWHYVERSDEAILGLVTVHPHHLPDGFNVEEPCKYFIRSKSFAAKFSNVTETQLFTYIGQYCSWKTKGPLGNSEIILHDINGVDHIFSFESFSNSYDVLTLGIHRGIRSSVIAVS